MRQSFAPFAYRLSPGAEPTSSSIEIRRGLPTARLRMRGMPAREMGARTWTSSILQQPPSKTCSMRGPTLRDISYDLTY